MIGNSWISFFKYSSETNFYRIIYVHEWVSRQCTSYDWKILRNIRTYFVILVNSRICAFELIFKNLNCISQNFTTIDKPFEKLQITVPNQSVGSIFVDEHPNKKGNSDKNHIISISAPTKSISHIGTMRRDNTTQKNS